MKNRGMRIELQMKVKKYFEYLNDESNNDEKIQEIIMKELASDLRNEVLNDIYGKILKSKKLFYLNFSEKFLNELSLKMKEQRLGPEDIIYKEKEKVEQIYFIMNGEVVLNIGIKNDKNEY